MIIIDKNQKVSIVIDKKNFPILTSLCSSIKMSLSGIMKYVKCGRKWSQRCKIMRATMWQKIVTTCSQNLLYVTSVTKMWHSCSLLRLVDFLSQMENKTTVLLFTFCDNLMSIFAVRILQTVLQWLSVR